jgi:hypothetical protein
MNYRLRNVVRTARSVEAQYKDYEIHVWRDHEFESWYMQVRSPAGSRVCDGYVPDSAGWPIRDAVTHALRGAMLIPAPGGTIPHEGRGE